MNRPFVINSKETLTDIGDGIPYLCDVWVQSRDAVQYCFRSLDP